MHPSPLPSLDSITQGIREVSPVADQDGTYWQQWEVYELPFEQAQANTQRHAEAIRQRILEGAQQRLDDFARTRAYDGILSLCTYATDSNQKFAAEGQCGVTLRGQYWAALAAIEEEAAAGTRPLPTSFADIEAELPVLAWPQL